MVDVIQPMIERLCYTVTARTSSIEGLEAFRGKPDRFDLVITDFTMPNMTGMELAKELLKLRSDIPIILCTGYSEYINEEKVKKVESVLF
jgi:two-component system cell cycle sensor histidine kinase/response regulator CckA